MSEKCGLDGIWEDLSNNLIVSVNTHEDNSSGLDSQLITEFTITNGAPNSDDRPDIFFEEVVLTVGVPPNMHVEKHNDLASGESFTYEHRSRYSDLGRIMFSVDGMVSPSRLLRVKRSAKSIPSRVASLSIASYVKILKDINIHKWLNDVIVAMPIPRADASEVEVETQKDRLGEAKKEISDIKKQLQNMNGFIIRSSDTDRRNMSEHETLVDKYLTHTVQALGELGKMLDVLNAKTISTNRDGIVASLSQNASQVDRATEALLLQ